MSAALPAKSLAGLSRSSSRGRLRYAALRAVEEATRNLEETACAVTAALEAAMAISEDAASRSRMLCPDSALAELAARIACYLRGTTPGLPTAFPTMPHLQLKMRFVAEGPRSKGGDGPATAPRQTSDLAMRVSTAPALLALLLLALPAAPAAAQRPPGIPVHVARCELRAGAAMVPGYVPGYYPHGPYR